jgi:hypothetical protein
MSSAVVREGKREREEAGEVVVVHEIKNVSLAHFYTQFHHLRLVMSPQRRPTAQSMPLILFECNFASFFDSSTLTHIHLSVGEMEN